MNLKTISVIALDNRDFANFDAKLAEAVQWIALAARQGAELAVLPEYINRWCGDGPGSAHMMSLEDSALDDWQRQTAVLFEAAVRHKIAVTIPVIIREGKRYANCFFLISKAGKILGRYDKMQPTPGELDVGVVPGKPVVIDWDGVKVGGGICFDTNFQKIFESQVKLGAELFLVCSLWPGGTSLNWFALWYSTPMALAYPAWSRIIDVTGKEVVEGGYRYETLRFGFGAPVYTATLNLDRVRFHGDNNQQKMVDIQRRYGRKVRIVFDQPNSSWFVESLSEKLTVQEVMREFDLLPFRQYLSQFKMF